ncbi:hypothetical protein VPH35_068308 [Triticum aestivum]
MASTLHPPNRRSSSVPIDATANDGVLPLDLLYDILVRLPVKPICRFRAVCTSWHSLLCHPDFIATAHGPNIAIGVCYDRPGYVLDMDSGDVIKRVSIDASSQHGRTLPHETASINLSRAVLVDDKDGRLCLFDRITGAVKLLLDPLSSAHMSISYTLGCVAFTGEYKVLTVANSVNHGQQICKILTLDDNGGERWREAESPLLSVKLPLASPTYSSEVAVVEGVSYFLVTYGACARLEHKKHHGWILAFDLGNEMWKPSAIRGPAWRHDFILATLEGQLVACHDDCRGYVELWFLVDPDLPLWCMRQRIVMSDHELHLPAACGWGRPHEDFGKPLAVLNDRRIVVWMRVAPRGPSALDKVLRYYDTTTGTFTDGMHVARCDHITLPPWNLLYSGRGAGEHKLLHGAS